MQDIAVFDQLAISVQNILHGSIEIRLIRMVAAQKSTGLALYDRLKLELKKFQLPAAQTVGCSFDVAANMSGQCNGLQAQLKKDNPDMQYVHCYAHALNLVMTDAAENSESQGTSWDFLRALLRSSLNYVSDCSHYKGLDETEQ